MVIEKVVVTIETTPLADATLNDAQMEHLGDRIAVHFDEITESIEALVDSKLHAAGLSRRAFGRVR